MLDKVGLSTGFRRPACKAVSGLLLAAVALLFCLLVGRVMAQPPEPWPEGPDRSPALAAGIAPTPGGPPPPQAEPCRPGSGWKWTRGAFQPEIAAQVEGALGGLGLEPSVTVRQFGEVDSCGSFSLYALDFAITLPGTPPTGETEQSKLSGKIEAILAAYGKPRLGRAELTFSATGDTILLGEHDEAGRQPVASPSLSASNAGFHRRVYVVVYDPMMSNGQTLSQYLHWQEHATLTQGTIDFFQQASNGWVQYDVVETTVITDAWPAKIDGFRYTEEEYLAVLSGASPAHVPDTVDYAAIVNSPELDICGKVNRGEIDDVWLYGGPSFGYWESTLAGPGAYWYNSPPVPGPTACNRLIPIMGPSYERGLDCAVHNFGHRTESTMVKVYGDWQQNRTAHNWDRFGLVKAQSPDYFYSGCGSAHYPPNGTADYDYDNSSTVLSNCSDFANYPDLGDPAATVQPVTCSAWNCDELQFFGYWLGHLPANAGCDPGDVGNNWWNYVAEPAHALDPPTGCRPTAVTISGPSLGTVGTTHLFLAAMNGITATPPITYVWQATGQSPVTHVGSLNDQVTFTWSTSGTQAITVTASSAQDTVSDIHHISTLSCYARLAGNPAVTYTTVQAAVDAAADGDTVQMAGTCIEASSRFGLTQTVYIDKNLTLRGGYSPADWTSSDPPAHPTTLRPQGQGRVIYVTGNVHALIEGLHIAGGDAAGLGGARWGLDGGGGIYIVDATVAISGCHIYDNRAANGAGVYLLSSNSTLRASHLSGNIASDVGGGLFVDLGAATLDDSTVTGNRGSGAGGIYVWWYSNVHLNRGLVADNSADLDGGGISLVNSSGTWVNTVITDNQAQRHGSGLYLDHSSPHLYHVTIARNAGGDGSGFYGTNGSDITLANAIVAQQTTGVTVLPDNSAALDGVLWFGNGANTAGGGSLSIAHETMGDPAFAADGYHLLAGSAAFDMGLDTGITTDIDGDLRPQCSGYDLGADELMPSRPVAGLSSSGPHWLGQSTTFTNTTVVTGCVAYHWAFGDGAASDQESPDHTYAAPGLYTAVLTATNPAGSDTASTHVIVYSSPVAGWTAYPTQGVRPLAVTFTAQVTTTPSGDPTPAYLWSFGDGQASTLADPTHLYTAAGVYTVTLAVTNAAGSNTLARSRYITLYEPVSAAFSAIPTGGVAPLSVEFSNDSGGHFDTCAWSLGDGAISAECAGPSHTYDDPGTYTVTLAVSGPGGADTLTQANYISVTAPPAPGLIVQGHIWLDEPGRSGLAGVHIYRRFALYPGMVVATTDDSGYYQSDFLHIPGDETVTVWAELEGYRFSPEQYTWRHYYGREVRTLDLVAVREALSYLYLPLVLRSH